MPAVLHFAFDSSTLDGPTDRSLQLVADYLLAHPEQTLDAVGHTCPIGRPQYNLGLGMRRAEAVADGLMRRGVDAMRISSSSAGATQPVATSAPQYPANRRVELHFRATGDEPPDLVWSQQALAARFGLPPYRAVEKYMAHEEPGLNDSQEDWHWGNLTSTMAGAVDQWIAYYIGDAEPGVLASPNLDDRTIPVPDLGIGTTVDIHTVVVHPRAAVRAILDEIIADPTGVVGRMVGESAANRSTAPLPPKELCAPVP